MKRFLLLVILGCCFVFCRKNRQVVEVLEPQLPVVSDEKPPIPPAPPSAPDPEPPATPSKKLRQVKINGIVWTTLFYNAENQVQFIEYSGVTIPGEGRSLRMGTRMTDEIIYENGFIKKINSYKGIETSREEVAFACTTYFYDGNNLVTQVEVMEKKPDGTLGLYARVVYKNRAGKKYNVIRKEIYNRFNKLRERVEITYTDENGSRIEKKYDDRGELEKEEQYKNDDKVGYAQYLLHTSLDDYPLSYQYLNNTLLFTTKPKFGLSGSRTFTFTYDKEGYPIQCNEVAVAAIIGFTKNFSYDFIWE